MVKSGILKRAGGWSRMATAALAIAATAFGPAHAAEVGTSKHFRLITTQQYVNTIQHFFGPDIKVEAKFSPVPRTGGLLMAGTSVAGLSDAQVEIYQKISRLVSAQVVEPRRRDSIFPCKPKAPSAADEACARKFISRVIDNMYFVQPPPEHLDKLVVEAGAAADRLQDFYSGIQVTLEGMLLSPSVLFVAENEEPDPKRPGEMRLDADSQAARLSLFLWNAAPDPVLRAAARRGDLFNEKKRARVVDQMLTSVRVNQGVRSFFDDMFGLEGLETLAKDAAIYPYFIGGAASDAREQTLRTIVDHLLTRDGDYRDLYTTRKTFISAPLGVIYNIPVARGWTPYEFPAESNRAGILTHASFLAMNSHATRSSATFRGKALRELILCQKVPAPPANVDFSAVENPDPNLKTARQRIDFHLMNPVCAGCHKITDPIGLGFENFDGAGRYREAENGSHIDSSGNLDGKAFSNIEGLGQALRNSPAVPACLVQRVLSYATADTVPSSGKPTLDRLNKSFADNGYRLRPLLRDIVMSPAFSHVNPPATPEKTAAVSAPVKSASNH